LGKRHARSRRRVGRHERPGDQAPGKR
jgi:hypothetical protein